MDKELEDDWFDMEKSNPVTQPFRCPVCLKSFQTELEREEHQRINAHWKRAEASVPGPA